MKVWILGVGMGPQHVTAEVAEVLRGVDYVLAAEKREGDELFAVRRQIADSFGVELVGVVDPLRERDDARVADPAAYEQAVKDWHAARVDAMEAVLRERGGTAALLVWGDPSLYDSTIRVVEELASRLDLEWEVLPGISAPSLLAARHRIVLHAIGQPVHVTTARRLRADVAAGQRNLVVMLSRDLDLSGLDDWSVWWGANLGTTAEQLVAGRVGDVWERIRAARAQAAADDGWVMDICLLRAPQ